MAALHMIFSDNGDTVQVISEIAQPGDAILLASDGCYLSSELFDTLPCYMLQQDATDRGLKPVAGVQLLSDKEWFDLLCRFECQVTWP